MMKRFLWVVLLLGCFYPSYAQRVVKAERYKFEKTDNAAVPSTSFYFLRKGDSLIYMHNGTRFYVYPLSGNSGSAIGLHDTTTKAFGFYNVSATDSSILFECRESGDTVREIRAIRTGGTSAQINVTKNGSSDLLTANYTTTTSFASAGTLQNNGLATGDVIRVALRAISGTVTEIVVQLTINRTQQ